MTPLNQDELDWHLRKRDPAFFESIAEARAAISEGRGIWEGYIRYIAAVNAAIPEDMSLRDKDRVLWARSAAKQLRSDIAV